MFRWLKMKMQKLTENAGLTSKSKFLTIQPDLPSKVFDRPLRNFSGKNSDERTLQAIKIVKELRPDIWQRCAELEKNDEGLAEISPELNELYKEHLGANTIFEQIDLTHEIRKQVRRESGLWC